MLERIGAKFETIVVIALQVLLMIVIAIAMFELAWLLYVGITERITNVHNVPDLQRSVQRAFAGVLLVLLGLEIMETLRSFFTEHRVRVELIMIVALIAAGRHIIQLDFEHTDGFRLIGIGALVLALAGGYFLMRRSLESTRAPR